MVKQYQFIKPAVDIFSRDPIKENVGSLLTRMTEALSSGKIGLREYIALISSFAEILMSKRDVMNQILLELLFHLAREIVEDRVTGDSIKEREKERDLEEIDRIEERILLKFSLSRLKTYSKIPASYYWTQAYRLLEHVLTPVEIEELEKRIKEEKDRLLKRIKAVDADLKKELEAILSFEDFDIDEEETTVEESQDSQSEDVAPEDLSEDLSDDDLREHRKAI